MYYTYVLEGILKNSNAYRLYVGSTMDLKKRMKQHLSKSVKTTSEYKTLRLIYYEACLNKKDARQRELQLKTGFGRGYIKRRLKNYFTNTQE